MNKETIKEILYILIAITLGVFVIKFLIWLLPVILIGLCSYYIYKSIKKNRKGENKQKTKKKTIKIIDMVSDED
jgi:uncharacterized membrane protein